MGGFIRRLSQASARRGRPFLLAAATVLAALTGAAHAAPGAGPCQAIAWEGADYVVCAFPLRDYRLRTFLNRPDGQPWGGFTALSNSPAGAGMAMAMNGGMYRDDRSPVGLYIEDGKQHRAANTARGAGNFHMKPNGVFYVTAADAGVVTTEAWLKTTPKALYATQSGPMLVINGKLHPRFQADGPSLKMRNGVGVRGVVGGQGANARTVVFAISERPVSFGAFARLFRDRLKTPNALYLDGTVSSLYAPSVGRRDWLYPMGPIIAAFPTGKAGAAGRAR